MRLQFILSEIWTGLRRNMSIAVSVMLVTTVSLYLLGLGLLLQREVDTLKGGNMSFRAAAVRGLRFDQRLRGPDAQVDCELAFSLALKRAGWALVYDPQIVVDHFQAPRHDIDQRDAFSAEALFNQAATRAQQQQPQSPAASVN